MRGQRLQGVVGWSVMMGLLCGASSCSGRDDARAQGLDAYLQQLVPFGFSGTALVVEDGRVQHVGGYGYADWEVLRLNDEETVFDIGSLSKQFTAAAVLALVERGTISPHDPIDRYLLGVPEDKLDITVHHLLTHTSGLPEFHDIPDDDVHGDFQVLTREAAEHRILGTPLEFPPGSDWAYSNSGYTLLAAIVERVSAQPFEDFLHAALFAPAGMMRTGLYFQPFWSEATLAHGYRGEEDTGSPLEWTDGTDELWNLIGNGGILSSLDDLTLWSRALRDGTVLSSGSVEQLFTPHVEVREGLHYGYGWYIEDSPDGRIVRHGGANDFGFAARWRWYEAEDRLVVLLINREPPAMDIGLAASAIEELLLSAAQGTLAERLPVIASAPAGKSELDAYSGVYRVEGGGELIVRSSMGALVVEPRGPAVTRLLGFPEASETELAEIRRLDATAAEIVADILRGNYQALGEVLEPARLPAFENYLTEWWQEMVDLGSDPDDLEVMGTVPSWWSVGDERLATVVVAWVGERRGAFRLHWREGQLVGLGGGGVVEPATTLFAPVEAGRFIGYHLGIRHPIGLSFDTAGPIEVRGLQLQVPAGSVRAVRIDN